MNRSRIKLNLLHRSDEPKQTTKWASSEGRWDSRVHVDHSVLRAWQHAQAALFPKLYSLDLDFRDSDTECAGIMWNFLTPRITEVELSTDEQSVAALADDALQMLAERCTHITRFHLFSPGRAHSEQMRIISRLLSASTALRHVHMPDVLTSAAVMHLSACPNLRFMRIFLKAASSPRLTLSLPAHSFPAMERIHINDNQHGSRLVHEFVSSQAAGTFRDVHFSGHMPVSAWMDVTRRLSLHPRLTHISLALEHMRVNTLDSHSSSLADLIAPLAKLPLLESVQVKTDLQGLIPRISEAEVLHMLSHWPRLRCWMALTDHISLAAFVHLLELCPQLRSSQGVISCGVLPTEDAVARVEQLNHPYMAGTTLALEQCPSLEAVALIIARTFPHVRYVQHIYSAPGAYHVVQHQHVTDLIRRFARQRLARESDETHT
jgi:hypothetical protein